MVLDDLKFIHGRDSSDALGVAEKQYKQLLKDYKIDIRYKDVENIVVAGMGGSALAATYINSWPGVSVPFVVSKDYDIPDFVSSNTLFVASSYSGNTEETLAALKLAQQRGAKIAVITAGGKLARIAKQNGYALYLMPSDYQPRMAVLYNFSALIQLLINAGVCDSKVVDELKKSSDYIKVATKQWLPDVISSKNLAKTIALDLVGKSPVVYASSQFYPAAYKWKINFNENAKNIAWCNFLPEFNHNEFLGWSSHPIDKPYAPIFLKSSFDNLQIKKRFDVSAKLLSGKMPEPIIIDAQGDTVLKQLLWTISLGDFVSLYLALLNNLDPTPVNLIEKLKKELQ